MEIHEGDTVRLKKRHPCGGFEWQVVHAGADIAIKCLSCQRRLVITRSEFERMVKRHLAT